MANRRISTFVSLTATADRGQPARPKSSEEKKEMWSSLLDSVSTGKRLPEKSVLVLGGSPDTQRDFLESLNTDSASKRRPLDRGKKPPVANQFALGYTYQDVLDDDHEDTLARLSLYLLNNPSPSFTPLLKPLLTPRTLPHMLLVILLDWNEPWAWLRQLRDWIRVFRGLLLSLDNDCKDALEENILHLQKGRGATGDNIDPGDQIPLGPGEWDEPLGIPLCVVCQNADKIEQLERERGWKEDDFDFVLECLRTVLLKHGASLVYTMPSRPGSLQSLVHSSLAIQATLKRQSLKYNVTDRDNILIPHNWDSWGKIRTLREGFDIEGMSKLWSLDIQTGDTETEDQTAVGIYEETVQDPMAVSQGFSGTTNKANGIEVESIDNQAFLTTQQEILDKLRAEDDESKTKDREAKRGKAIAYNEPASNVVTDQIGPVQFNMGGIQVDADDILNKINARETERSGSPVKGLLGEGSNDAQTLPNGAEESNETLKNFFAGLMNRK
ncbi:hypothetical protein EJ05DRAFT_492725 [Pseudovirgaria hyperparasitica]|uniref:Dynein n=1 Tax=Pseudovirgaria hyperparasitica TaxID=470096 RepID=A0A6A6W837_9PEZI|nr:uncharacterized protein EJ05DRAFT_492725 [Pseudovirgaria hyperparasitica]KAF2758369.1 hypothetical protein EJ05DRAFT_492725 [Pseudovirgaria hyperparasitica]